MSVPPSPTLAVAWPLCSTYQREPRRWRSALGCALVILLLHLLLVALCWYNPGAPVIPPKPEVIAVRWQAAPKPVARPEPPAPPKPAALPQIKPKPVPVLTNPEPRREIKRVQPKPERKVQPRPQSKPQPARSAVTPPAPPAATKPVTPSPAPSEPAVAPDYQAPGLNNPALRYPPVSRRLGEEGKVRLRVLVSVQGEPKAIEIKNSSGYARLDEAARELVRRWHFLPAKQGSRVVEEWVEIPIVFKLRSR